MICPNCGGKGAVALRESGGLVDVYCNICDTETSLPIWWAFGKEYDSPATHFFRCDECGYVFESSTKTTWEKAKPGDYWLTAQGYIAKCPHCKAYARECVGARIRESHKDYTGPVWAEKKEAHAMQVSYNGFTGELMKLEQTTAKSINEAHAVYAIKYFDSETHKVGQFYNLTIYNREKNVTYSFEGIRFENIQFPSSEKCGHWEKGKAPVSVGYTCSACGGTIHCCGVREPEELPKYCAKCGAKMGGAVSFA